MGLFSLDAPFSVCSLLNDRWLQYKENSVLLLFYWADCRSRFIKISPCKYLPCFKFLRPCKAKIYCYIYKRTCSGSNVLTVFWKIYTFHCFYSKFMWSRFHSTFTYKYSIGMQILQIFIIMGWIQHNSISYKACVPKRSPTLIFFFFNQHPTACKIF